MLFFFEFRPLLWGVFEVVPNLYSKVDMKYIADPSMHSMPCVTPSPNGRISQNLSDLGHENYIITAQLLTGKFIACQSLDNRITIYMVGDRFKEMRKKVNNNNNKSDID